MQDHILERRWWQQRIVHAVAVVLSYKLGCRIAVERVEGRTIGSFLFLIALKPVYCRLSGIV